MVLHDISSLTPVAGYFIIGPLLLTGLAATGLYWMEYTLDVEYLTTPINGRAKTERAVQDRHFPQNFSDFDPLRISSNGKYAQLIIEVMQNKVFFAKHAINLSINRHRMVKQFSEKGCSIRYWLLMI